MLFVFLLLSRMFFAYSRLEFIIRIWFANIFPPFCRLSFHFIHGVIWAIEFLILKKSSLLFFYFVTCTCGDIFKNWGHKGLPLFLFKNCLHLSLWFILNFFCMFWGRGPEWFPCIWRSGCSSTHYSLKRQLFPYTMVL